MTEPGCPPPSLRSDPGLMLHEMMRWGLDRQEMYAPAYLDFGSSGLVIFSSSPYSMGGQAFEIKYECPPRCEDKKGQKFCNKQLKKEKCHKKSNKKKCAKTCGYCG